MEALTITVEVTNNFTVKGNVGMANMCCFGGYVDCENFKGVILPSGVDTQRDFFEEPIRTLSARYMLKGKDKEGIECQIFIENNCSFEKDMVPEDMAFMKTKPRIITDSPCLSYLETAELYGTIEPWEKGVIIHIFVK